MGAKVVPESVETSHCTVGAGLPLALDLNLTLLPDEIVTLNGSNVIFGTRFFADENAGKLTERFGVPMNRSMYTRPGVSVGALDALAGAEIESAPPGMARQAPRATMAVTNRTILDTGIPLIKPKDVRGTSRRATLPFLSPSRPPAMGSHLRHPRRSPSPFSVPDAGQIKTVSSVRALHEPRTPRDPCRRRKYLGVNLRPLGEFVF